MEQASAWPLIPIGVCVLCVRETDCGEVIERTSWKNCLKTSQMLEKSWLEKAPKLSRVQNTQTAGVYVVLISTDM